MDQKNFQIGWRTLIATYRLRPEDERDAEYFRVAKRAGISGAQWIGACDELAGRPQQTEEERFIPSPGDLVALAKTYDRVGKKAASKEEIPCCEKCGDGMVFFLRVEFDLDPATAGEKARQTFDLPADSQRSLEWFQKLRASPVGWRISMTSCFCDCRRSILEREAAGKPRPRVHSEVTGFASPTREAQQSIRDLERDLRIMLTETWPWAYRGTPKRLQEDIEARERYFGRLTYQVPVWARLFQAPAQQGGA